MLSQKQQTVCVCDVSTVSDMCLLFLCHQVICSIGELVEACSTEMHSGWRSLFGALRAVKIEYTVNEEVNEARQHHIANVLDVFDVFLNTDNVAVFSNAAVDCILCLQKYVHGTGGLAAIDAFFYVYYKNWSTFLICLNFMHIVELSALAVQLYISVTYSRILLLSIWNFYLIDFKLLFGFKSICTSELGFLHGAL